MAWLKAAPALLCAVLLWRGGVRGLPLLGISFSWLGDALLTPGAQGRRFLLGMLAFVIGYGAYSFELRQAAEGALLPQALGGGLALLLALALLKKSWANLSPTLRVAVPLYMLNLVAMAWHAGGVADLRAPAAVFVFILSDTLIAIERFITPLPGWNWLILTLYYLGQALMTWRYLS